MAGALTLASVLLYPKTLGGGAIFSGWVPFGLSVIERISPEARKVRDTQWRSWYRTIGFR
jgi:hypothetical protein